MLGCVRVAPGGIGQREASLVQRLGIVGVASGAAFGGKLPPVSLGLAAVGSGGVRLRRERATERRDPAATLEQNLQAAGLEGPRSRRRTQPSLLNRRRDPREARYARLRCAR